MKKLLSMLLITAAAFAAEYKVTPASGMKIDGVLDEAAWGNAAKAGGFTMMTAHGSKAPSEKTEFRILADNDAIYFGVTCYGLEGTKDNLKGEVTNAWTNDLVEIFLAPTEGKDEYYQFALTAGGAYWSQYYAESGNIRPDPYKPGFELATGRTADAWVLEVRFPYTAFYMTSASKMVNQWAVNVCRYSLSKNGHGNENSSWAKLNNNFHEIKNFNIATGLPPKQAKYDLCIPTVDFNTSGKSDKGYSGTMNVSVTLESAPAGEYTLETGGQKIAKKLNKGGNTIPVKTSFEKDGRVPVKLVLKNSKGEVVADRSFPVLVDSTAYALNFTTPQYGGNFYPGENADRLKGYIKVNTDEKQVTFTVAGKAYTLPVQDGKAAFDINVASMKGDIPVSVGELSAVVKHVNDALAWIRDGQIIVNGKAEYLLGWYGGTSWIVSEAALEKYPTLASKHAITFPGWLLLDPGRLLTFAIENQEVVFDRYPSQKVLDATKKAIEKFADSPQYSYYLSDEPECRGLSPIYLKHLYQYIKKLDPKRIVIIISRDPVRYIDCCDVINPHPYISPSTAKNGNRVYGLTIQRLRDTCARVEALKRPDKALMLTPQVHCYSFNNMYADYPTFDETQVSIWSSIVHGGQGITPYIWYDHMARPALNLGCDFIYNSIYHLRELLTNPVHSRIEGDEGRRFELNGKSLYAICNVYNEKRSITFKASEKILYRFRSPETFKPANGSVTLEMKPYETIILTSEKMDKGLSTEAEVRAQIAKEEYERTHRGNILFGKARTIEVSFPPSKPYDRQNAMEQQDKMFDGNIWVSAWIPLKINTDKAWYEMAFTDEVPKFSKARIYGANHQDLTFKIWKFGEWIVPEAKRTANGKYELELDFGKELKTVKVRLEFTSAKVELYEFELLK